MSNRGGSEPTDALGVILNRMATMERQIKTLERDAARSVPPGGFRWDTVDSQPHLRRISDETLFRLVEI